MHLAAADTTAVTLVAECVLISVTTLHYTTLHFITLHYVTITCLALCAFVQQHPTLKVMN